MIIGQSTVQNYRLHPENIDGKNVMRVGDSDEYLAKFNSDKREWELVDSVEKDIPMEDLRNFYGTWKDKEVTKGMLFWKKVERPLDGKVQADEVKTFEKKYPETISQYDHMNYTNTGWMDGANHDILKPDAKVTVQHTELGTIAVLEEKWTCIDEQNTRG